MAATSRKPTNHASARHTGAGTHRDASGAHGAGHAQVPHTPETGVSSYESLTRESQQRVYGRRPPKRRGQGNAIGAVLGLVFVAAFIVGGIYLWTHRSVPITLNDERTEVRIGSSLAGVRDAAKLQTQPGNYVSVGGNVLAQDEGYPFSAVVDGEEVASEELGAYRIKGGEAITIGDGADRVEEYDVSYREVQPKLVFEGDWGAISFVKQWGKVGKQEIRTGKESGETAEGDWVEELRDCIIMTKNVAPEGGRKLVALTFDDGPAATYTEQYLDILERYGARATFFNLSSNELNYPELAQRVAASGNQICSHTNQHLQLTGLSADDLRYEVSSAHDTILEITGVDTTVIRPPYGDFSRECWVNSNGSISVSVLWNQDTLDWSLPGVDAIVSNALTAIEPGSVILMHDGGGTRDQDLEALPKIIEELQSRGYELVTLSEIMASDPDVPDEIAKGNATMPEGAVWPTEIGEAAPTEG